MTQQQIQAKLQKQIKTYLAEPCNKVCFTCSQKGPGYLLCDFNVYVCTKCSGLCRQFSWRVKGISMSNFTEKEVSELGAAGNGVAREHYLANFNFEKFSMPEPGDEAAILKFMTSVFVKQTFAKGNEPRSKGGKPIQQKPQPTQKPQNDDDDDDWDPFTPSKGQPQRQQPAQPHSQPAQQHVQQHQPQQPQQLRPSNQPAPNSQQPAQVQQQPAQPVKTSDLLLGLNFAPVQQQPQPQPQPLQPVQPLQAPMQPLQAPMQYQPLSLDQQRLMQQQILAQQQLLAQQQQFLAHQMGQVSLQPGYPMQFQPIYQQQQFGSGGVLQPQQHHAQPQPVPTLTPEQQAQKQKQQQAQDAQFAGLFSNLLNDKDFGNQ